VSSARLSVGRYKAETLPIMESPRKRSQKLQKALHAKAWVLVREPDAEICMSASMSGIRKWSHGRTTRHRQTSGNRYVLPKATAPHLDSTKGVDLTSRHSLAARINFLNK
jgi:hypothetical protein